MAMPLMLVPSKTLPTIPLGIGSTLDGNYMRIRCKPQGPTLHHSMQQAAKSSVPNITFDESNEALDDCSWSFVVPWGAHRDINPYGPNARFPQTNLAVLIG
ncbi:hypothetical protein sscle_05g046850 [Sclerotinia sclerotiorum 1980 UF-70]|uniref:Uncharacterized protein n=1 Tax=Sclerotinia sclerotiorum (strain ATCC 18683 / 1980 / Ss-1) TaxID=665079 RepID=A0A1D9Q4P8_SCLS1|nr:hypothetical protein sscle_05g046850 [Sclerotinia sclerotiorum 1980 UF-70]